MKVTDQEILKRIARHLMLYGSFIRNLGLLNGKMGITLFFFEYAMYTKNGLYKKFAEELIGEIYEDITKSESIDFENGLCGIAWGIGYLAQKGFVEADEDEVLEELDIQILEKDVRRMRDYSLETGLKGIAYYVLSRYNHKAGEHPLIHYEYIKELAESLMQEKEIDEERDLLVARLNEIEMTQDRNMELPLLDNLINRVKYKKTDLFEKPREEGILKNGYTGIAFKLMKKNQYEKKSLSV